MSQFHSGGNRQWNNTGIVLCRELDIKYRYIDLSEDTLGQKIRKQRLLKGLSAPQLAALCDIKAETVYIYEGDYQAPHHSVMEKIVSALKVDAKYFKDDYYSFVLSDDYASFLRKWRKENTKSHKDIKKKLGVSLTAYLSWEKGARMSRKTFNKIKKPLLRA